MYNKKSLYIIGVFLSVSAFTMYHSLTSEVETEETKETASKKNDQVSSFVGVNYFKLTDRKPSISLKAQDLNIINNIELNFSQPIGSIYSETKKIDYSSNDGQILQNIGEMKLSGEVKLNDSSTTYSSDLLTYNTNKDMISANGNVKASLVDPKTKDLIEIESSKLLSFLSEKSLKLTGAVKGEIKRKRKYEGKLRFKSEELELNSLKSLITLSRSVEIKRNNYDIRAENAEIFLENFNKRLKYYSLSDDVKLEERILLRNGKKQNRRAYAQRLEAHQKTGKVILSGAPRVEQGKDVIKGYQITLRENSEVVEVDESQTSFSLEKE